MFFLIKIIVWLAGLAAIAYFALPKFGYELNVNYFKESRATCEQRLQECSKELIKQGTENAQCNFQCLDPKIIIKKK